MSYQCEDSREIYFICDKCGNMIKKTIRCHSRFANRCKYCANEYRKEFNMKYSKVLDKMKTPKMMTLTLLKTDNTTLRIKYLPKMFHDTRKILRERGYKIRKHLWVVEPPNHIHSIIDSDYIPQHELSEIWEGCTGDSYIVDIRKVKRDGGRAWSYLKKYVGKMTRWNEVNLSAVKGVHIVGSWGILDEDDYIYGKCPYCESIGTLKPMPKWSYLGWEDYMRDKPPPDVAV